MGIKKYGYNYHDIMLDFDGQFGMAIVNEICTKYPYNQLVNYKKWLDKKYDGNYIIVYLIPYRHIPSLEIIDKNEFEKLEKEKKLFLLIHSNQFLELMKIWEEKCSGNEYRNFFKEYEHLFIKKIKGDIFMTQQKSIEEFIIEKPEYIKTAIAVSEKIEWVKKALFKKLIEQTNEIAHELKLTTTDEGGLHFRHEDLSKIRLRIKLEWRHNENWTYGVVMAEAGNFRNSEEFKYIIERQPAFQKIVNLHSQSNFWYAYGNLLDNATSADVYLKIANSEMKQVIREKLIVLLDAFNKLDPEKFHFIIPEQMDNL